MTPARLVALRQAEQRQAADVLGVKHVIFFDENDGELFSTLKIREQVVREIRRYRPEAIIAPDPTRYFFDNTYINHPDHRAAGEIALGGVFPATGNRMYHPELLSEGLEPHSVRHIYLAGSPSPDRWIDISAVIDRKIEAIRCHASQIKDMDALEKRMRENGKVADEYGHEVYREGFRHLVIGG
jgi:LmbE family N-acetylglucosaminyl deacetylase